MKMKIRKTALLMALIMILAAILPLGAASADTTGTVKGGWLILRASPSFSGSILASYPSGTVVRIVSQVGSWYEVYTPDNMNGYMYGDYLQISSGSGGISGGVYYGDSGTAYVTSRNGLNVRLRSGPGKGYSILATFSPGTKATVLSAGNNWSRVQIGKYTGYMMTEFLSGDAVQKQDPNPYIPVKPQPDTSSGTVYVTSRNGKGVNLRSGPSKNYPSIGFYSVGTAAEMLTEGSTWSYIGVGNRYGYMMSEFLTTSKQTTPVVPVSGSYVVSANGRSVNLRTAPTTAASVITAFPVGTRLTVITRGSDWYFVQIGEYFGYMMRQFIYDGGGTATTTPVYDWTYTPTTVYDWENTSTMTDLPHF